MYISYKEGFNFQLENDYTVRINISTQECQSAFITLDTSGVLTIKKGYAWNGLTGPTIQTINGLRASLIHDALYQLMEESSLDRVYRINADIEFRNACLEDGMWKIRAWTYFYCLRWFAESAATKAAIYPVKTAPLKRKSRTRNPRFLMPLFGQKTGFRAHMNEIKSVIPCSGLNAKSINRESVISGTGIK
jgi:hypothetical protein